MVEQLADKAAIMKATIRDMLGKLIATARKKETEMGFLDHMEKAKSGILGRALAICGYGTLQASKFDEQARLVDTPMQRQNAH